MRDAIKNAKRIVVKSGEQYIMLPKWSFKFRTDRTFSPSIIDLANQGKEVILVSSGATGAGLAPLGFKEKPRDLCVTSSIRSGRTRCTHSYV